MVVWMWRDSDFDLGVLLGEGFQVVTEERARGRKLVIYVLGLLRSM